MNQYPTWKFHATLAPVIVADPSAEAALGDGWYDAPVNTTEADLSNAEYNPAPLS